MPTPVLSFLLVGGLVKNSLITEQSFFKAFPAIPPAANLFLRRNNSEQAFLLSDSPAPSGLLIPAFNFLLHRQLPGNLLD